MELQMTPEQACREIAGELKDIAGWLAGGDIDAEQFRAAVATLEARKLARFGFRLESAISRNRQVHFNLRFAATGELCASMDVNPRSGELEIQYTCT